MGRHSFAELLVLYAVLVFCFEWSATNGGTGVVQAVSVQEDLTLSRDEMFALDKFRDRVFAILPHAYMKHDIYLIRWLRARNFNVQRAEQMLRDNLQWRREEKIDNILNEDWSDMLKSYPYTNDTFDKTGRPITTINVGHWNFRAAATDGKMPGFVRYISKLFEENNHRIMKEQRKGKKISQWQGIMNLDGFNEYQHTCALCLSAMVSLINIYENYFPGMAHKMIQINAPGIYQIVLNVIRPMISPITKKGFIVLGPNKQEWMAYLDKDIAKDQLTKEFGGTLEGKN